MRPPFVHELLTQLTPASPVILVYLVGCILSVVFLTRHKGVSLLALAAFAGLLVNLVVGQALLVWVLRGREGAGLSDIQIGWRLSALGIARGVIVSICMALLMIAVFGWRGQPRAFRFDKERPSAPRPRIDDDRIQPT